MPKSTTPKLNDTQLIILSSASQREDGLAVLPESLKAAPLRRRSTKLLGLGFLKEVRVKRDQPVWRSDEEDKPVGLKITKAGSAAIGVAERARARRSRQPNRSATVSRSCRRRQKRTSFSTSLAPDRSRRRSSRSCGARPERPSTTWSRRPVAAAHHAGGAHGLAKEGLRDREGQEPEGKTIYRIAGEERAASAGADARLSHGRTAKGSRPRSRGCAVLASRSCGRRWRRRMRTPAARPASRAISCSGPRLSAAGQSLRRSRSGDRARSRPPRPRREDPGAVLASQRRRRIKPGTELIREWAGKHPSRGRARSGFAYAGQTSQPLRDRPADHRHELERTALLRPARQTASRRRARVARGEAAGEAARRWPLPLMPPPAASREALS